MSRPLGPIEFAENILDLELFPGQRLIAKLVYGVELDATDKALLTTWRKGDQEFGCDVFLPSDTCREIVLVCGMRASKTFMAALFGSYETYRYLCLPDPWKAYGLPQGSPVFGMVAATSKDTAQDTVFAQLKPMIVGNDFFEGCGVEPLKSSMFFPTHNLTVRVGASSSAALVGRTDLFAIFDELDQCPDSEGRMGGEGIYRSLSKGTSTMNGLTVSLTSPLYENSMSMRLLRASERISSTLGLRLPTWYLNPDLPRSHPKIAAAFELDPEGAARDFGALPSAAIHPFFRDRAKLAAALCGANLLEEDGGLPRFTPIVDGAVYAAAGDPAVKNDAFGIALGHKLGEEITIDLVMRLVPDPSHGVEVDPDDVQEIFTYLCEKFPLRAVVFDTYQFPSVLKRIRAKDILTLQHHVLKPEYDVLKNELYSGKALLPQDLALRRELEGLELHNGKRVDHPPRGSKDVADAVCQVVYYLAQQDAEAPGGDLPALL